MTTVSLWTRNRLIAMILVVSLGIFFGVILGFFVFNVPRGPAQVMTFSNWLKYPMNSGAFLWGAIGAIVGAAIYAIGRLSNSKE